MTKTAMIEKLNAELTTAIEAATKTINDMKVADLRKLAPKMGLKNAKSHKGAELKELLVGIATENLKAEFAPKFAEAENLPETETTEEPKAKKAGKKSGKSKKATKAEAKAEKKDKRYKATKVETEDVDKLVADILKASPAEVEQMDLWHVNRKVLIEVMKQLHCKLWYRTYDKPTMIAKITGALGPKAGAVEVETAEEVEAE